jgi:D-galactarolactone cycloisomerase
LKITDIRLHVLRANAEPSFGWSQSWTHVRGALIVEVRTDDGLVGWGEAGAGWEQRAAAAVIDSMFRPLLLGRDPRDIETAWETLHAAMLNGGLARGIAVQALSGVDIALWDLAGKALNQPVHRLLGGAYRDRITAYATGLYYTETPDQTAALVDEAARYVEGGFLGMKMKVGGLSPAEDLKNVAAVRREIGPDVYLAVDANQSYNAATAVRVGRGLEESDVLWFEEPVPFDDLAGYLEVKSALRLAVSGGEALYTRFAFRDFIARRAFDIAQPDLTNAGGLTEARRIANLASTFGLRCYPHVWGTGIALAAGLHLLASLPPIPTCRTPRPFLQEPVLEFDRTPNPLRDEVCAHQFSLVDGAVAVPTGPGLGVEPDPAALARFRVG